MEKKTRGNKGFNKLRGRLPHRYTRLVAEKLENITPIQVRYVFEGRIKNPELITKVYEAAIQVADLHSKAIRLNS